MAQEPMLDKLLRLEGQMGRLLQREWPWVGHRIVFKSTVTHRLERKWEDCRVRLNRYFPRPLDEEIIHPHSWPGAFRIVKGGYDQVYAYAVRLDHSSKSYPPVIGSCYQAEGSYYTMEDHRLWHAINTKQETLTICLMGPKFQDPDVKTVWTNLKEDYQVINSTVKSQRMGPDEVTEQLGMYRPFYPVEKTVAGGAP